MSFPAFRIPWPCDNMSHSQHSVHGSLMTWPPYFSLTFTLASLCTCLSRHPESFVCWCALSFPVSILCFDSPAQKPRRHLHACPSRLISNAAPSLKPSPIRVLRMKVSVFSLLTVHHMTIHSMPDIRVTCVHKCCSLKISPLGSRAR